MSNPALWAELGAGKWALRLISRDESRSRCDEFFTNERVKEMSELKEDLQFEVERLRRFQQTATPRLSVLDEVHELIEHIHYTSDGQMVVLDFDEVVPQTTIGSVIAALMRGYESCRPNT